MKNKKLWISIGAIFIVLGAILFTVTACSLGFDFGNTFGNEPENTITVTDGFESIDISSDTADIDFVLTSDGSCKVSTTDKKGIRYTAAVDNGVLKIKSVDERKWFERIFNFTKASLTVYLPESEYATLVITEDTGDINIPSYFKFRGINLNLSTGDVNCYASTFESVKINGSTGNVKLEGANAGYVDVTVSTGKITVNGADCAGDINVKVSTGDVIIANSSCKNLISRGSTGDFKADNVTVAENATVERSTGKTRLYNLVCKNLTAEADTGDLDMVNVTASESFSIKRSTGDVSFDGCDAEKISVVTDTGSVKGTLLSGKNFDARSDTGKIEVPADSGEGICKITTDTGNIRISIK